MYNMYLTNYLFNQIYATRNYQFTTTIFALLWFSNVHGTSRLVASCGMVNCISQLPPFSLTSFKRVVGFWTEIEL